VNRVRTTGVELPPGGGGRRTHLGLLALAAALAASPACRRTAETAPAAPPEPARAVAERFGASLAEGIAAGAADKRRSRVMIGLVAAADRDPAIKRRMRRFVAQLRRRMTPVLAAGGLATDPESVAFFHSVIVGCAVLQLARDNAEARREARAVLRKASSCIARS